MTKSWSTPPGEALRVGPGFDLSAVDASSTPGWEHGRSSAENKLEADGNRLSEVQERLYAHGRTGGSRAVLLVLQGMDTAGKGGIVRHVLGMVDPQGVQLHSFGVPTEEERAQHYLHRIREALPSGGRIGVFDRSHYEDVLVVRVNELVPPDVWEPRYDEINAFEREVVDAGTVVVKVMLHVSQQEQKTRLRERLERPDKYWKFNPKDVDERAKWPAYQEAYQAVLDRTSTEHAPWHVVPADSKWYARLAVGALVLDAVESLQLDWPPADFDVEAEKARLDAQPF
ncbi:polyphosphate kinase 2 family protein [Cellulomonas sp. Leaf334]|uniref:polyphosphate kinase 2 family protein n=1 Tax=Cellulomonas sp. Leaf334 TaxID=1736339 RepID=UPI0006F9756F|nr:polyphosphate kinase 2 family protein [Cellulomonas sp. Leaf334]KQR07711.1 polyphosphate kinase [Cellulomonas sp. Leaf334]